MYKMICHKCSLSFQKSPSQSSQQKVKFFVKCVEILPTESILELTHVKDARYIFFLMNRVSKLCS